MSRTKPNRMYHSGLDKYGDIIEVSGDWVTARLDGEKGTGCWEVDAPYIKIFIDEENLKPAPLPENPLTGLLKDRERLDWIFRNCCVEFDRFRKDSFSNREEVDEAMQAEEEAQ